MAHATPSETVRDRASLDARAVRKALHGLYLTRFPDGDPSVDIMTSVVILLSKLELQALEPAQISDKEDSLREAIRRIFGQAGHRSAHRKAAGAVEHLHGDGLGPRIEISEGRDRLQRHVTTRTMEDWAGPVAGAGEIERRLGIPRSTLGNWRSRKAAIGLLRGERKLAYPIEQFVDARPVPGLADVLRFAPDERAAWLWLKQPHPALDGRFPLSLLTSGDRGRVADAAERDFAIERDVAAP